MTHVDFGEQRSVPGTIIQRTSGGGVVTFYDRRGELVAFAFKMSEWEGQQGPDEGPCEVVLSEADYPLAVRPVVADEAALRIERVDYQRRLLAFADHLREIDNAINFHEPPTDASKWGVGQRDHVVREARLARCRDLVEARTKLDATPTQSVKQCRARRVPGVLRPYGKSVFVGRCLLADGHDGDHDFPLLGETP